MKRLALLLFTALALTAQQQLPSPPNFIFIPEPAHSTGRYYTLARDGGLTSGHDLLVDANGHAVATPSELHAALQALSDAMNAAYSNRAMNADVQWRAKTK